MNAEARIRCNRPLFVRSSSLPSREVYPAEIEADLNDMPGVVESAVIGVPHANFGEAVVAVVVPRPGTPPDAAQLVSELKSKIANFKVPEQKFVCPRCGGAFHCGVKDGEPCPCGAVKLDEEMLRGLRQRFSTCLCLSCLRQLHVVGEPGT